MPRDKAARNVVAATDVSPNNQANLLGGVEIIGVSSVAKEAKHEPLCDHVPKTLHRLPRQTARYADKSGADPWADERLFWRNASFPSHFRRTSSRASLLN